MRKNKSKAALEAELRILRKAKLSESIVSVLNNILKYGCYLLIARYSYLSIDCLSGLKTESNIVFKLITDFHINEVLSYLIGVAGVVYGEVQRRLKLKTIERLQGRKRELEERVDPGRSSSNLLPNGETNPVDM